jgi:hypothetical protein
MRDAASGAISGMAGQILFHRQPKPKKKVHKNSKRRAANRESVVWGQLIDQIGPPPAGVKWIHVCDRGADDYEVFCRAFLNECGWVVRVARLNRQVLNLSAETVTLQDLLAATPTAGQVPVDVPRQGDRPARTAQVSIRYAPLRMPPPRVINDWIRQHHPDEPILMWVISIAEDRPPVGVAALQWVLLTSAPVSNVSEALQIAEYYQQRWGIEEYHKVLKTGCRVEQRYYETSARLERVTGLLAVLAVRLLQIRSLADEDPQRPAQDVVPASWINTLAHVRKRTIRAAY